MTRLALLILAFLASAKADTGVEIRMPDILFPDKIDVLMQVNENDSPKSETELSCESLGRVGTVSRNAANTADVIVYPTKEELNTDLEAYLKFFVQAMEGFSYSKKCYNSRKKSWKWGCSKRTANCPANWEAAGLSRKFMNRMRKITNSVKRAGKIAGMSFEN